MRVWKIVNEIHKAVSRGIVKEADWDPKHPVLTFWEVSLTHIKIAFIQHIDKQEYLIESYHLETDLKLIHRAVGYVNSRPYTYTAHWLPRDVNQPSYWTGNRMVAEFEAAGLSNIHIFDNTAYPSSHYCYRYNHI